ncbi:unnamed protein product, partial [Pylaiella littoralis]
MDLRPIYILFRFYASYKKKKSTTYLVYYIFCFPLALQFSLLFVHILLYILSHFLRVRSRTVPAAAVLTTSRWFKGRAHVCLLLYLFILFYLAPFDIRFHTGLDVSTHVRRISARTHPTP